MKSVRPVKIIIKNFIEQKSELIKVLTINFENLQHAHECKVCAKERLHRDYIRETIRNAY